MHGSLQRTSLWFLYTLKKNLCSKGDDPEFVHGFDWYTTLLKHTDFMYFFRKESLNVITICQ